MASPARVAIVGVGNCASSLVQGVAYYRNAGDAEFWAAFDIDERKLREDLSGAIFAPPNSTVRFAESPAWRNGAAWNDARWPRSIPFALDGGLKGALLAPPADLMKCPPEQWRDRTARQRLERCIVGDE